MIIKDITLKNFKSYGNAPQTLELNTEKGELCLISAGNGFGKCVSEKTLIEIDIENIILRDGVDYSDLHKTELGRKIFLYIKENKPLLYDKIEK